MSTTRLSVRNILKRLGVSVISKVVCAVISRGKRAGVSLSGGAGPARFDGPEKKVGGAAFFLKDLAESDVLPYVTLEYESAAYLVKIMALERAGAGVERPGSGKENSHDQ